MSVLALYLGVFLNLLFLVHILIFNQSSLLRPSVVFHISFFLQVQIGLLFSFDLIHELGIDLYQISLILLYLPLFIIVVIYNLFNKQYTFIFNNIKSFIKDNKNRKLNLLNIFYITFFVIYFVSILWYILSVGIRNTGIFALVAQDPFASETRENGMKLLGNPLLAYVFTIAIKLIAPGIVAIMAIRYTLGWSRIKTRWGLFIGFILFALPATIFGSRGAVGLVVAVGCMVVFFSLSKAAKLRAAPMLTLLVFGLPLIMVGLKMASLDTSDITFQAAFSNLADRFFLRSLKSELWQIHYVNEFGHFGLAGIPKLASMLGIASADIFYIVGTYFRPNSETISASTSFITVNYALFGWAGYILLILQILFMDYVIVMTRRLNPIYSWFISALWILPAISLAFSAFETIFITRGIAFVILIQITIFLFTRRAH